jgi:hypothetical protein
MTSSAIRCREPQRQVEDHAGKETGFCRAQQETHHGEPCLAADEGHRPRRDAPGEHDARDPAPRAEMCQKQVGWYLEDGVRQEEDARTEAVGRGRQA